MNPLAADTLEGFQELLDLSGVTLTWNDTHFQALLNADVPTAERYDLTPGDDREVTVSAFISTFPGPRPAIGDSLEDGNGGRCRITAVRPKTGLPIIRFTCRLTDS